MNHCVYFKSRTWLLFRKGLSSVLRKRTKYLACISSICKLVFHLVATCHLQINSVFAEHGVELPDLDLGHYNYCDIHDKPLFCKMSLVRLKQIIYLRNHEDNSMVDTVKRRNLIFGTSVSYWPCVGWYYHTRCIVMQTCKSVSTIITQSIQFFLKYLTALNVLSYIMMFTSSWTFTSPISPFAFFLLLFFDDCRIFVDENGIFKCRLIRSSVNLLHTTDTHCLLITCTPYRKINTISS